MTNTSLAPEWDDYLVALREDAHQLLAWGYADVRRQLATANDEYEMTGLLRDGMDARINSPMTPDRFLMYAIHNEKPTSPFGELGKNRPKLDIQIERCGARPKRFFTFEAKRLRDDASSSASDTMRQYLGGEGIGRFVSRRYASDSLEAAMLGCIQAHDAEFWFNRVGSAFETDALNGGSMYGSIAPLRHANIIQDFPDERMSVHSRGGGVSIQIFHIFIDCQIDRT